jgi:hypothetical protein
MVLMCLFVLKQFLKIPPSVFYRFILRDYIEASIFLNFKGTFMQKIKLTLLAFLGFLAIKSMAQNPCDTTVFYENNGLVVVEMEQLQNLNGWVKRDSVAGFTGSGYIVWTGEQFFNAASSGRLTYKVYINTPGKYAFDWRTVITYGTLGTEHNDSWLNIAGVDNFYAEKSSVTPASLVKPKPECNNNAVYKCPNGNTLSSYFKIYTGGRVNFFLWQAHTSDNDPHLIYFEKNTPGLITINIAARSSYHGLDRMVMYRVPQVTQSTARSLSLNQNNYRCKTSAQELPEGSVKIYPNPTQNNTIFEVQLAGQLDIMDINGRVLQSQKLGIGQHALQTNLLPKGVYTVRFMADNRLKMQKLIVQ